MPRSNAFTLCALSLAFAAIVQQNGRAQTTLVPPTNVKSADVTCKIYSLADLVGDDATYGNWIADTILNVIEPDSWTFDGNFQPVNGQEKKPRRGLSYYAPTKVMVVYHTPAVHEKIGEFLGELKKASAKAAKPAPIAPAVQQAQFVPGGQPAPLDVAPGSGYPVPGPVQRPKHLFHYVIRYEGEGLIDSNVVKFAKELMSAATKGDASATSGAAGNPMPAPTDMLKIGGVGYLATQNTGTPPMPPQVQPVPTTLPPAPPADTKPMPPAK